MTRRHSLTAILPCNDLDASEAFYARLGFTHREGDDGYRMLSNGRGGELHLNADSSNGRTSETCQSAHVTCCEPNTIACTPSGGALPCGIGLLDATCGCQPQPKPPGTSCEQQDLCNPGAGDGAGVDATACIHTPVECYQLEFLKLGRGTTVFLA